MASFYLASVPISSDVVISIAIYTLLALISVANDKIDIAPLTRLALHLGSCAAWVVFTQTLSLGSANGLALFCFLVLLLGWSLNLYNFMDGSDGLCGSMTLIGFGAYALMALHANALGIAAVSIIVCGAVSAFLYWNLPPAKVFLGDGGSVPLGFLAAAIGIVGVQQGVWGGLFPFVIFAMFWVDATFTLFKRMLKREAFWRPHNTHWYQKAIRAGNSHRNLLLVHVLCNVLLATVGLTSQTLGLLNISYPGGFIIFLVMGVAAVFGFWAEREFAQSLKSVP